MNKWTVEKPEHEGVHKNKNWLSNGQERALFKPDTEKNESAAELETSKIAKALGIPCARIEVIEFDGQKGCISYDVKKHSEPDIAYAYPDDLYVIGDRLTSRSKTTGGDRLELVDEVTLETVKTMMPHILPKVVEMLFLDCLVHNNDRHGRNWELVVGKDGSIHDIAPLYDHGLALWSSSKATNICCVPYSEDVELTHCAMFERLATEFPEQVAGLMEKCAGIELCDYAAGRFARMQEIHERAAGRETIRCQKPESLAFAGSANGNKNDANQPSKPKKAKGPEL